MRIELGDIDVIEIPAMLLALADEVIEFRKCKKYLSTMAALGHERRFRDVLEESSLPPAPERLWQRSEPTLRPEAEGKNADLLKHPVWAGPWVQYERLDEPALLIGVWRWRRHGCSAGVDMACIRDIEDVNVFGWDVRVGSRSPGDAKVGN